MKKLKELWSNNRVLLVLSMIVLICFIVMCVVCVNMFFGGSSSPYGDRLDGMEEHALKEEDKTAILNKIQENEGIASAEVRAQGKIIYIRIALTNVSLDRAKEIANLSLEVINDDYKSVYDIHYTLTCEATEAQAGYTVMGAKNINRSMIIWNNNNPMPVVTEE